MGLEKHKEKSSTQDQVAMLKNIVVYNDDVNTFEHVIECFMTILGHDLERATKSAYTIHFKGKCDVKSGTYEELEPYALKLLNEKLSAKIE